MKQFRTLQNELKNLILLCPLIQFLINDQQADRYLSRKTLNSLHLSKVQRTNVISNRVARASTIIPDDLEDDFLFSDQELQEELNRITDHATDQIFQQAFPEEEAIMFSVSRLAVQNVFQTALKSQ